MRKGTMMIPRFVARFSLLAAAMLVGALPAARAQNAPATPEQATPADGSQQPRHFRGNLVAGHIQSISPTEMKIAAPDGSTVTVALSAKTQYRIEQQPAKLEDFKVGTAVFVRGNKTGDTTWDAELVAVRTGPPPMTQGGQGKPGTLVAGTVKSIDGTKITIVRFDGATQTIEVDENTSLQKRRESITLADIHPGDVIAARGETKDGAFAPKTVNLLDPAQVERFKQFLESQGAPPTGTPPPPAQKKPEPETKPQGPR